ncbi:MAG: YihY/virulence factor BrkB family protein [Bacteroidota bacterium]
MPGFYDQSIYDVLMFVYREIQREGLYTRANSIAYSFFLSLFPAIIALFTLIPYLLPFIFNDVVLHYLPDETALVYHPSGGVDYNETLITQLRELLPNFTGKEQVIVFFRDLATQPRTGMFSIGFVLAIFFASNGMMTMMSGFEKSYMTTFRKRSPVRKRIIALFLINLMGGMVIASVLLLILGDSALNWIFGYLNADEFNHLGLDFLRLLILVALLYFGITLIYRFGAATKKRFRYFSPGAALASVLSILSTTAFAFYVNNFGVYNKLYGSIGTIIVIMLWIQINALILLIGFELNASIAVNRDLSEGKKQVSTS